MPAHLNCVHDWHKRMGHLNYKTLQKMPMYDKGIKMTQCKSYITCEVCHITKTKAKSIPKISDRISELPLQILRGWTFPEFSWSGKIFFTDCQ